MSVGRTTTCLFAAPMAGTGRTPVSSKVLGVNTALLAEITIGCPGSVILLLAAGHVL